MSRVDVVFDERGEVVEYGLLPKSRVQFSDDDEFELRALVGLAWERRGGPDFRAALDAIEDWHDRRFVRRFERKQRQLAALHQVLRETDPFRSKGGCFAA
jgi:hypothetical protein